MDLIVLYATTQKKDLDPLDPSLLFGGNGLLNEAALPLTRSGIFLPCELAPSQECDQANQQQHNARRLWYGRYSSSRALFVSARLECGDQVAATEGHVAIPVAFCPTSCLTGLIFTGTEYGNEVATVELAVEISITKVAVVDRVDPEHAVSIVDCSVAVDVEAGVGVASGDSLTEFVHVHVINGAVTVDVARSAAATVYGTTRDGDCIKANPAPPT